MAWQAFGSLAAGNQPLSLFDTLTGQIGQTVVVPCTATGTNDYSLTVNGNGPLVTSYNNYNCFAWVAPNSSTGATRLQVAGIGLKKLFTASGNQGGSGDIVQNNLYIVAFNSALDSAAGGFIIVSATPSSLTLPVSVANGGTGDSSLTAFAVLCGGTTSTAQVQSVASVGSSGNVLTSNGAGALPTFQPTSAGSGSLVSIVTYSSTQTITIPAGATKAFIRMVGGGGSAKSTNANAWTASGAGAYLEKYLTSLTPANTLAFTLGAGGTNGGNGGNTVLASGSQSITTLTAGGGGGVTASLPGQLLNASGGSATNGDINVTGMPGIIAQQSVSGPCVNVSGPSVQLGGWSELGLGTYGSGATAAGVVTASGLAGVAVVFWFT